MRRLALILALAACDTPAPDPMIEAALRSGAPALLISVEAREDALAPFVASATRDGKTTWRSADGVSVTTQAGLLHATRGLGADMLASDTAQSQRRLIRNQPGLAERFHTFLNGEDQAITRAYVCEITNRGARQIDVGRGPQTARLMAEDCASLSETFTNLYWIAPSGSILQSRQWAGAFTGPLAIRDIPN